jgi:hypothetical protein
MSLSGSVEAYNAVVPDREVAARLAGLRRAGVDLERRLRADPLSADDSEAYWRGQIDGWRASIESQLTHYPFQLRAIQAPIPATDPEIGWQEQTLGALAELRTRLDAIIPRIAPED